MTATPDPVPWLWHSYLPKGAVTLVAAFPKVGKSTLVYPLIRAIVRGEPFLGYSTAKTPVLILSEERTWDVRQRMERFGLNKSDTDAITIHSLRENRLPFTTEAFTEVRRLIRERNIGLYVVDTVSAWWDVKDENDNAEVNRAMQKFIALTGETGAAALLVHHEGKNLDGTDGRAIRGASALFGAVDQGLTLRRRDGGSPNQRVLHARGRYAETPEELVIELDGNEYRRVGSPAELTREAIAADVWSVLSVHVPQTPDEIVAAMKAKGKVERGLAAVQTALLKDLVHCVVRDGAGKKGSAYRYRRRPEFDGTAMPPSRPGASSDAATTSATDGVCSTPTP
jgi:KaiC/GvpD/RAD55 family RecA-like ATPase